jgi:hypothetical protein
VQQQIQAAPADSNSKKQSAGTQMMLIFLRSIIHENCEDPRQGKALAHFLFDLSMELEAGHAYKGPRVAGKTTRA